MHCAVPRSDPCMEVLLCVCAHSVSGVRLSEAPHTLLSVGFSRQEYWSGLPFPSPGDLPDPGVEPASLASPALAGPLGHLGSPWRGY